MTADTTGYIDTHYTRTLHAAPPYPRQSGAQAADVCIVGGGIAGVSTAWELTARGLSVVLLEARRIGWGASGRNGGMLSAGFAVDIQTVAARTDPQTARALYALSREGVQIVLNNTRDLKLQGVNPVAGKISVSRYPDAAAMRAWQETAAREYGHDQVYLPRRELRDLVKSDRFHDGLLDSDGHHIHPLNYCTGLAAAVQARGGQIFENSAMVSMDLNSAEKIVHTAGGSVRAQYVVLCGSGHTGPEFGKLHNSLLPIATYVVSTQGLGDRADQIMTTRAGISDTRLSCDYFRITPEGELLWGGGMSALSRAPANLSALMQARIAQVFPQISDVQIAVAWTGIMGYARHKMPYLQQLHSGVWTATALGGHGLNTGPAIARVLAEAITEKGTRHHLFRAFGLRWNGGPFGPIAADAIGAGSILANRWRESRRAARG